MSRLLKIVVGVFLLLQLSGCFQVQLYGPVSGATITITDLRDGTIIRSGLQTDSPDSLLLKYGQKTWDSFGPVGKLWLLGVFLPGLDNLPDERLYLVTASGGADADSDGDGQEDSAHSAVSGSWHAIVSGAQLKSSGPKVSALTEALYQWLRADLAGLSDEQILYNLDLAAAKMVTDVDKDGAVTGADLLHWSRLFDEGKLLASLDTLNQIADTLVAGNAEEQRLAWSRQLVGLAVSTAPPPPKSLSEQLALELAGLDLEEFFAVSYRWLLQRTPEAIVELGQEGVYALDFVGLDNITDSYEQTTFELAGVILAGLQNFDRAALPEADQISYDVYLWYLQGLLEGAQYQLFSYPASSFITGVPSRTQFFFSDIHPLDTLQDARDYVTRLQLVDTRFEQLQDKVALRADAGIIEPVITLRWGIDSLRRVGNSSATSTRYYDRLRVELDAMTAVSQAQRDELLLAAKKAVAEEILPAYAALISDLEALRERAPQAIGVGQFAGGKAFYAYALRQRTTTDMTPAQIHQLGLDELARLHVEIRQAAGMLGYNANATLPTLFSEIARGLGSLSGDAIVETYEDILDRAYQNLPEAFDILPQQELVVIGGATGGFYLGGSADGSRPGAFYAANVGEEDYFMMPSLAYHEGVPGHHLQIALASEQDLPDFRRYTNYTAFVEGWALYAERLAFELGWYESDPFGNLGRLQFEAIRAARLVVDTGIHDLGWSWDQAVHFYRFNTGSQLRASQGSVGRFMRWPGQATAYMIGMNKLLDLRAQMKQAQGANYDIRQFHNLVLSGAAMPFGILEDVVERAAN